jgi:hypothetical protein
MAIDKDHDRVTMRTVVPITPTNRLWCIMGRKSVARLSRFDGGCWNYGFVAVPAYVYQRAALDWMETGATPAAGAPGRGFGVPSSLARSGAKPLRD